MAACTAAKLTYWFVGVAHGLVSAVAFWSFALLMDVAPASSVWIKIAYAMAILPLPVIAPIWIRRRA